MLNVRILNCCSKRPTNLNNHPQVVHLLTIDVTHKFCKMLAYFTRLYYNLGLATWFLPHSPFFYISLSWVLSHLKLEFEFLYLTTTASTAMLLHTGISMHGQNKTKKTYLLPLFVHLSSPFISRGSTNKKKHVVHLESIVRVKKLIDKLKSLHKEP